MASMATLEGHGGTVGDGGFYFAPSFSHDFYKSGFHDIDKVRSETLLQHIEIPTTVPLKTIFSHSSFSNDIFANDFERLNFEGIGPEGNFGTGGTEVLNVGQETEDVGRGVTSLDFPHIFLYEF